MDHTPPTFPLGSVLSLVPVGSGGEEVTSRVVGVAVVLSVVAYAVDRWALRGWGTAIDAESKRRGETVDTVRKHLAMTCVMAPVSLAVGVAGLVFGLHYSLGYGFDDRENFRHFDTPSNPLGPLSARVADALPSVAVLHMGSLLHQTLMWALGWERRQYPIYTHAGGLALWAVLLPNASYLRLSSWVLAMELSTPPLLAYRSLRLLNPASPQAPTLAVVFGAVFSTLRVAVFSYELFSALATMHTAPSLYPACLTPLQNTAVMCILLAGWIYNIYWCGTIVDKATACLRELS